MQSINTIRLKFGHSPVDYFCNKLSSLFEYEQSKETFGITALPLEAMKSYIIHPRSDIPTLESFSQQELIRLSLIPAICLPKVRYSSGGFTYKFLSKCQQTELAVTAVHAEKEIQLYLKFLTEPNLRNST